MHGNSGGGGGGAFFAGAALANNPEAAIGLVAIAAVAFGIYGAALAIDSPSRDLPASGMVQNSIEHCLNASHVSALYRDGLKDRLTDIWSKDLKKLEISTAQSPVCVDKTLGDYPVAYNRTEMGTNYRGEYRVVGVAYKSPTGAHSYVVRPDKNDGAKYSTDTSPDYAPRLKGVLSNLQGAPEGAYQQQLPDGTKVAVLMQHDAVTQADGSSEINDNDGIAWADAPRMAEVSAHYSFAWPTNTGGARVASWDPAP